MLGFSSYIHAAKLEHHDFSHRVSSNQPCATHVGCRPRCPAARDGQARSRLEVPCSQRSILTAGEQPPAVRRDGEAENSILMPLQDVLTGSVVQVPDSYVEVSAIQPFAGRGSPALADREGGTLETFTMPLQDVQAPPSLDVPDP